jgi:hypothetical protein
MGVASCRSIFLLSDVVFNRVFVLSRYGFRFAIGVRSVVACVVGFYPGPRPSPARPGAPLALVSPLCPLPSLPFSHLIFPRSNLLSSISLSPRGALGFGDDDHRIWILR